MQIRTLRPTEIAGRHARRFACLDLPQAEAEAMIDAGLAEPWPPAPDAPALSAPSAPSDAAQPE